MAQNNPNFKPRFVKGQSGNPAGLPKGYIRASTYFNKILQGKIDVESRGPDGRILKKKEIAHKVMMLKALHDAVGAGSASERTQARESILSRIEGKPVQVIGVAPDTAVNISISSIEDKL